MVVQVKVNTPQGEDVLVDLCEDEKELDKITVEKMQEIICGKLGLIGNIRIVYQGETLEDSKTLAHYKVHHMSKVQTVLMLPGGSYQ